MKSIERIYRRRLPLEQIVTPELARYLAQISWEVNRQIGILVDRRGYIQQVVIGEAKQIFLPEIKRRRSAAERLSGLRYIHTHLDGEPLGREDLTDLALLRFDCILAIQVDSQGLARSVHAANLIPGDSSERPWEVSEPLQLSALSSWSFPELVRNLEKEFARPGPAAARRPSDSGRERVLLVGVATAGSAEAEESLKELKDLAESSNVVVVDSILQRRPCVHPQFVVGLGKIKDLSIQAMQTGAGMIIFDQNLTAAQVRSVSNVTDLKILDRTQLILELFAQRAKTRDGKIQVELAQLRYRLPRLVHRNTGLSRLAGGIGGMGPGETKLEIDRRRVRERIHRLEKEIETIRKERGVQRAQRTRRGLPLVCLVGYTNAGKSTLLNTLTQSNVYTASRMFATLDPATRKLWLQGVGEILLTDTVGFIRDLPADLVAAFRATLEELRQAHVLVHVIDGASRVCEKQMAVVESMLQELDLDHLPRLNVFNKSDLTDPAETANLCRRYDGVPVCALDPSTLEALLRRLAARLPAAGALSRAANCEFSSPAGSFRRRDGTGYGV
ncbi:MAG: GTPase HflX [bacterium]